jgi:hypothetical protein
VGFVTELGQIPSTYFAKLSHVEAKPRLAHTTFRALLCGVIGGHVIAEGFFHLGVCVTEEFPANTQRASKGA